MAFPRRFPIVYRKSRPHTKYESLALDLDDLVDYDGRRDGYTIGQIKERNTWMDGQRIGRMVGRTDERT